MAGTKIQMVSIREDDFRANFFERFVAQTFYRGLRAHGQKKRSFDRAVRSGQASAARASWIGLQYFERKIHLRLNSGKQDRQECLSYLSVSGEDEGPAYAAHHIDHPNAEGNGERFGAFQFFRVHGGKPDGQENQRPEGKEGKRFAERYEPLRGFVG